MGNCEFLWNVQQRITKSKLRIAIDPNEAGHYNVTFIALRYCTALQVRLFIPILTEITFGWTAVIYHGANVMEGEI